MGGEHTYKGRGVPGLLKEQQCGSGAQAKRRGVGKVGQRASGRLLVAGLIGDFKDLGFWSRGVMWSEQAHSGLGVQNTVKDQSFSKCDEDKPQTSGNQRTTSTDTKKTC